MTSGSPRPRAAAPGGCPPMTCRRATPASRATAAGLRGPAGGTAIPRCTRPRSTAARRPGSPTGATRRPGSPGGPRRARCWPSPRRTSRPPSTGGPTPSLATARRPACSRSVPSPTWPSRMRAPPCSPAAWSASPRSGSGTAAAGRASCGPPRPRTPCSPGCSPTWMASWPARCSSPGGCFSCPITRAPAISIPARWMAVASPGIPIMMAGTPGTRRPTGSGSCTTWPATSGSWTARTRRSRGGSRSPWVPRPRPGRRG